jgi:hypothetical protein
MRKVVVTLEVLPYTARSGAFQDCIAPILEKELDYESGERIVSIEVEAHP